LKIIVKGAYFQSKFTIMNTNGLFLGALDDVLDEAEAVAALATTATTSAAAAAGGVGVIHK
jgi:hypothetical protein